MSDTTSTPETGAATGGVRLLQRLEGVVLFVGMTLLYGLWDGSWWVYAILFLAPDLQRAEQLLGLAVGLERQQQPLAVDAIVMGVPRHLRIPGRMPAQGMRLPKKMVSSK